jgi:hypothetical protein
MLMLTAAVGASVLAEAPSDSYNGFYLFCIGAETSVLLIALWLRTNASTAIVLICACMIIVHVSGYVLDGYPPYSPPRLIIPFLEHAELVVCIVLSNYLIRGTRNHESPTT